MDNCKRCGKALVDGVCRDCASDEVEKDPSLRELLFEVAPDPVAKPETAKTETAKTAKEGKDDKAEKLPPWKIAMQNLAAAGEDKLPEDTEQKSAGSSGEKQTSAKPATYSAIGPERNTGYAEVEKNVETFMVQKKHEGAENPYVDLLKKYGLSPLFLAGAFMFSAFSIFLTFIKVGQFWEYIESSVRLKDQIISQAEFYGRTPLDTVIAVEPVDEMILSGYINMAVYLLTLIPTCLYLIGFILNIVALSGPDRARQNSPGCLFIRIAAYCNIAAATIVMLAYMREAYVQFGMTGLPSVFQWIQMLMFFIIQFMVIYVSITVIKITKNLHHVITTGRYSDSFSQFLAKIVIVLAFVQLADFVLLLGNATLFDWLGLVSAAGTVLMAFAFAQFSLEYNSLHETRKFFKKE